MTPLFALLVASSLSAADLTPLIGTRAQLKPESPIGIHVSALAGIGFVWGSFSQPDGLIQSVYPNFPPIGGSVQYRWSRFWSAGAYYTHAALAASCDPCTGADDRGGATLEFHAKAGFHEEVSFGLDLGWEVLSSSVGAPAVKAWFGGPEATLRIAADYLLFRSVRAGAFAAGSLAQFVNLDTEGASGAIRSPDVHGVFWVGLRLTWGPIPESAFNDEP